MSNIAIVVVAGGHIFVGQVTGRDLESVTLNPCRQLGRLGTVDLVAGLIDGPTPQTTMMKVIRNDLRIPVGQIRFDVQADEATWLEVLE